MNDEEKFKRVEESLREIEKNHNPLPPIKDEPKTHIGFTHKCPICNDWVTFHTNHSTILGTQRKWDCLKCNYYHYEEWRNNYG